MPSVRDGLGNLALCGVLLSSVMPVSIGKLGITASVILLLFALLPIPSSNIFIKLLVTTLLMPGIAQSFSYMPTDLLRFIPVLMLTWLYPYKRLTINFRILEFVSIIVICYLFITQVLIGYGIEPFLDFRDRWYPIQENPWNYGIAPSLFPAFREYRFAGILYNPNVYASVVFLVFLVYLYSKSNRGDATWRNEVIDFQSTRVAVLISAVVILSLFLSGSRTYLFPAVMLLAWSLIKRRPALPLHFGLLFFPLIVFYFLEYLIEGTLGEQASLGYKASVFFTYLFDTTTFNLLFGSDVNVLEVGFDSEYGCWLGRAGILGLSGIFMFYLFLCSKQVSIAPLATVLLLVGLGNTQLYGLLTGVLSLVLVILAVKKLTINASKSEHI